MKTLPYSLVFLLVLTGLSTTNQARAGGSLSVDIRIGNVPPPPPPQVVVVDPGPAGPPPWAAHHWWFWRSRDYYYYPDCDVYYRPLDRVWFYLDGGQWRMNVRLPDMITMDLGRCVPLTMYTDKPYRYQRDVVRWYPRDYFSHVRIRGDGHTAGDKHGDRRDDTNERGHDHGPGLDHGHGHKKGDH